jgi:hypothetical protein
MCEVNCVEINQSSECCRMCCFISGGGGVRYNREVWPDPRENGRVYMTGAAVLVIRRLN